MQSNEFNGNAQQNRGQDLLRSLIKYLSIETKLSESSSAFSNGRTLKVTSVIRFHGWWIAKLKSVDFRIELIKKNTVS